MCTLLCLDPFTCVGWRGTICFLEASCVLLGEV